MKKRKASILIIIFFVLCVIFSNAFAGEDVIKMSTTTSTENSGLFDVLLPEFTKDTGIQVKVLPKGTGAAIRDGMDGNVDIIFVHDKVREEKFVQEGYGAYRLAVMHNDFVVVGPKDDPAGIKGLGVAEAFKRIADSNVLFVSRGDDSGTHSKEKALWAMAGIALDKKDADTSSIEYVYPAVLGERYISIGQGMGKTLTFAEEKQAYTIADRGTYLNYRYGRAQGLDLDILCEGDENLYNPYGIIPVNPEKYPDIKFEEAEKLAKWIVSERGQRIIADYKIHGYQAFFPDAIK